MREVRSGPSVRAASAIPDVDAVGDPVDRLPHIVTFQRLPTARAWSDAVWTGGLALASGSACTASTLGAEPCADRDGRAHPRKRPSVYLCRDAVATDRAEGGMG